MCGAPGGSPAGHTTSTLTDRQTLSITGSVGQCQGVVTVFYGVPADIKHCCCFVQSCRSVRTGKTSVCQPHGNIRLLPSLTSRQTVTRSFHRAKLFRNQQLLI